ncbi:MAG: MG2 domain-containing protein, partial [Verrucomicrobiota bacterium]|nr:MG2 domain-containing protein [Verrucomicrobiota bacterium]
AIAGRDAFPESRGGKHCHNLVAQIEQKSINIQTESIWNAPWPELSVAYRNITEVHFRLVPADWNKFREKNFRLSSKEERQALLKMEPVKSWRHDLPPTADYKQRTELFTVPDNVKPGFYFLISSADASFRENNNQTQTATVWISDLSLVVRSRANQLEGFVVQGNSGDPVAGAQVDVWLLGNRGKYVKKTGTTDESGMFSIQRARNQYRGFILAQHNGQQVGTTGRNNYWGGTVQQPEPKNSVMFFTDRAIYRPGQTIQFKGIALAWHQGKDDYNIMPDRKITVILHDPNREEVERLDLKTNGYGSLSGSFTAPKGRLTGNFQIATTAVPRGQVYFRVEEYKRPKFLVELGKPKQSPKLGETVQLNGRAADYTGAPIGSAKGKFHITRQARWPVWWRWHYWGGGPIHSQQRQIAHGTFETKPDGSFVIEFDAIPDASVPEESEPTFNYQIVAEVTDGSGETRSDTTHVPVGYTTLQATMTADAWQTVAKLVELNITTQSLAGVPESAKGKLTVYALEQPKTIKRSRLIGGSAWPRGEEPEVDGANPETWPLGQAISTHDVETNTKGQAKVEAKLAVGVYRAILETSDRLGKPVKAILLLRVVDPAAEHLTIRLPQIVMSEKQSLEPGETLRLFWGTGYDVGRAFIEVEHRHKIVQRFWTKPALTQRLLEVPVTEEMRGGFTVHVTQVRENRMLQQTQRINVPWSNMKLKVKWERFVSKLRPGQQETWTATISGPDAEKAVAEMVATLYDASLDAFSPHHWQQQFSIYHFDYTTARFSFTNNSQGLRALLGGWKPTTVSVPGYRYWAFPPEIIRWYSNRRYKENTRLGMERSNLFYSAPGSPTAEADMATVERQRDASIGGVGGAGELAQEGKYDVGTLKPDPAVVPIRKNLNETAFFFPHLISSEAGEVKLSFTMPEALTEWKLMAFAHDAKTRSGFIDGKAVTSLDLMVRPNAPRFLREGDALEFTTRVINTGETARVGSVKLNLQNAETEASANALLGNTSPEQKFAIPAGESRSFSWRLTVPDGAPTLVYQVTASAGDQGDGEENYLPVLSRRVLITESLPLPIRDKGTKKFRFDKLVESDKSDTLQHQSLTVQVASNPAWYAVLALPYLMEYPHECTEQTFNRLYANTLAAHIAKSDPRIRRVFDLWKGTDALDSPLEKNEELKSLLLLETPWVREAKDESQARRNVGILFDKNRLDSETKRLLQQLARAQNADGGWPWMPGGRSNDYITLYVTTGFARLRHLGVEDVPVVQAVKALGRLDGWIKKRYDRIVENKTLDGNHLSSTVALYLYCRSFYLKDRPVGQAHKKAFDYFVGQAKKHWLKVGSRQSQAHVAIALHRLGDRQVPGDVIKSILEHSVTNEELGMFWRDTEHSWWWYRAPIETQAMMIEAFNEITGDKDAVRECQIWLIKQKQTQAWKTTKATADAVYSILLGGDNLLASTRLVEVSLGGETVKPEKVEAGTGFYQHKFGRGEITSALGQVELTKHDPGVAWGSVHWQYLEDMAKVTPHEATPLSLAKEIYVRENTKSGQVLKPIGSDLAPGDELVVRLVLRTDRDMEFVHMNDQRGSGTEPVNVLSGYRYRDGLAYYESTRDASSHFFIDYLPKGTYVFEYPVKVFHRGRYQSGIANIQSMYAPEFNSHSASQWLEVK